MGSGSVVGTGSGNVVATGSGNGVGTGSGNRVGTDSGNGSEALANAGVKWLFTLFVGVLGALL